jgi:hypothetical protein
MFLLSSQLNLLVLYCNVSTPPLLSLSSFISLVCCPGQFLSNLSTQICPLLITWLCELITKSLLNKKRTTRYWYYYYGMYCLGLYFIVLYIVHTLNTIQYIPYHTICHVLYCMVHIGLYCIVFYCSYWVALYCILLFILGCIVLYCIV